MIQNYRDLTRKEMEAIDKDNTIVLIPLGALEQHGSQAPLGTDSMIAEAMPKYVKEELEKLDPDFPMLIFPVIPVGLSIEHLNFAGSVSFKPDTYYHMLYDIAESIQHHGFKKLVFLICHGGNRPMADILSRQLRHDFGIFIFVLASGAFLDPQVQATISPENHWDFHGGEMETSMIMAIHPETVKLELSETGYKDGGYKGKKILNFSGDASINWMGEDLRTSEGKPIGIGGDPRGATAEKGEIIFRRSAEKLAKALLEVRDWDINA
ncbi:MAG: creatininase family protein [Oribacterium sp.]|nr:creatininase family protein [Oribacterium sp.]